MFGIQIVYEWNFLHTSSIKWNMVMKIDERFSYSDEANAASTSECHKSSSKCVN